ncbi:hypothetical protein BDV95DRAFT_599487 [Massariosphaeria phaeospora]|uniref:Uncharacterized protein n=1 Tax=Massariosphaeria phaeospora TaxID=100035 RepID=A0A7C8HZ30_9PLEO|nr:hypothetical protein BDV95DRAFT_599487 [Massariosphaeria phaeospora]
MSYSQRSQLPVIAPIPSIFHAGSSKRLGKARATTPISPALSSTSSGVVHELPESDFTVLGERFEVNFERVSRREGRLVALRLGYRAYSVELVFNDANYEEVANVELVAAAASAAKLSVDFSKPTLSQTLKNTTIANELANANFKQQDTIIAFRNFFGDYTSAAQASIVRAVFNNYEISQKFYCFLS